MQINGLSQKSKFVQVQGPGMVYIDMKQSKLLFKKDQISLYVIILYGLLYFTMFMVILLDRRDPLPLRDDRANLVVNDLAQQFGMPA